MNGARICRCCGVEKPLGDFYRNGQRRRAECKECRIRKQQAYYRAHRDDVLERERKRYAALPAEAKAAKHARDRYNFRLWKDTHPEEYRAWRRERYRGWKARHPDRPVYPP